METLKELYRLKQLMIQLHFISATKYLALDLMNYTDYGINKINDLIKDMEVSILPTCVEKIDDENTLDPM